MTLPLPLLRAPPFPWQNAAVTSDDARQSAEHASPDPDTLFTAIRKARVGGDFWADDAGLRHPAATVIRPGAPSEVERLDRDDTVWIAPIETANWARALRDRTWRVDVDPWSVLPGASRLLAHGNDEWIALARIAGVTVDVLSPGRFGAPGEDATALDGRVAELLAQYNWHDPFTGRPSTIEAVVELLALWRCTLDLNRPIVAACGMAWWKRKEISRFLWHPKRPLAMVSAPTRALRIARKSGGALAIWPSRVSPALVAVARQSCVSLVRVEDGFVRSVGLGVDLVPPSSVVVDALGIHFDPSGPSDLEAVLNHAQMSTQLLRRAQSLRETIVSAGISKYSADNTQSVPERIPGKRLVLVPGQVEDDMSVIAGGSGLTSNLELLRRARSLEPEAEIWFRPHPDVDAGHRRGKVPDTAILAHADHIVRGGGMAPLLDAVDAVHVLTSLTGFEALMRGRDVTCHGSPFYAGWGLTRDLGKATGRRTAKLSLDALVAGVLILYPRYLDPVTGLPCPPEVLVSRMASATATNRLKWIVPMRRWQGYLMKMFR